MKLSRFETVSAGLALLQFLMHVLLIFKPVEFIAARLTFDDTYYYLQTAWNYCRLGFATFDGLHSTNGLQFLWFCVCSIMAFIIQDKEWLLRAVLILCALMNVMGFFLIIKLGRVLNGRFFVLIASCAWFYLNVKFFSRSFIYISGMEISLHALLFWFLLYRLFVFLCQISDVEKNKSNLVWVTFTAALLPWIRLDGIFFSAPFLVFAFFCFLKINRFSRRSLAVAAVLCIGASAVMLSLLAAYQWMGGHYLPTAGLVKQTAHSMNTQNFLNTVIRPLLWTYPADFGIYAGKFFGSIEKGAAASSAFALFFLAGITLGLLKTKKTPGYLTAFFFVLFTVNVIHVAYISGIIPSRNFRYQTPHFISFITATAIIIDAWIGSLKANAFGKYVRFLLLLFLIFSTGRASASAIARLSAPLDLSQNIHCLRVKAAEWIDKNLEKDAILAAWNAGEIAYFSGRRTVNLDGLINSYGYYKTVLSGKKSLEDYLREENVDYLIDHMIPENLKKYSLVRAFGKAEKPLKLLRLET